MRGKESGTWAEQTASCLRARTTLRYRGRDHPSGSCLPFSNRGAPWKELQGCSRVFLWEGVCSDSWKNDTTFERHILSSLLGEETGGGLQRVNVPSLPASAWGADKFICAYLDPGRDAGGRNPICLDVPPGKLTLQETLCICRSVNRGLEHGKTLRMDEWELSGDRWDPHLDRLTHQPRELGGLGLPMKKCCSVPCFE